jgi:hypothetical protein
MRTVGGGLHRDRIHGVPRHSQFSGDCRDCGAVNHQPPQHITRTPTRRCRPRRGEHAQILIEYNPPALGCEAAVARDGDPQNQGIAGDR